MKRIIKIRQPLCCFAAIILTAALTGCSTVSIDKARANFYAGRFARADENLKNIPPDDKDAILYLSERGMIRQNLRLYDESSKDWREATEINERLADYSVGRQTVSLLVNDRVLTYRGMPFERTFIYTFLAKNYFAQYNWDYAAICARNIIAHLENLNGFPDIAYSRYLAGFCLEMINDHGNAAIQYRAAAKIFNKFKVAAGPEARALPMTNDAGEGRAAASLPCRLNLTIDPETGRIVLVSSNTLVNARSNAFVRVAGEREAYELVCFIGIGKMPKWCRSEYEFDMAPYAEIYCEDKYLGRSYPFANTAELMIDSKKRLAVLQAAKTVTRVVIKEIISESVESQNQALGAVTRLILFSLEQPDTRCWETLPLWLQIARVSCPTPLENYRVVFKTSTGVAFKSKTISAPISRRGNIFISFCRDIEGE